MNSARIDVVKFLIDSGQVQGEVLEYIRMLEDSLDNSDDMLLQLDARIAEAVNLLEGN